MRNLLYLLMLFIAISSCKKEHTATVIYQDALTTNDLTWTVDSTNYGVSKFDQGHYSIRSDSPVRIRYSFAPYATINFPYTVQVDGTAVLDNTSLLGSVAVIFNRVDSIDYTVAEVWTNGTYRIWKKVNGTNSTLVNFTYNSAIQSYSGNKNTIKVIQNQSSMELQINNTSMGTFNISLPAQLVETGPAVSTAGSPTFTPVTGLFDNFSIWKN